MELNNINEDIIIAEGSLNDIIGALGEKLYENVFLHLINKFTWADEDAKMFLAYAILDNLLTLGVSFSGFEYDQSGYEIIMEENFVLYDIVENKYYLCDKEECTNFEYEDSDRFLVYTLTDEDFGKIFFEVKKMCNKEWGLYPNLNK